MKIVLDTNCLIQCIGYHSPYRPVWDSLTKNENTLCVSNEILEEYAEVLGRLFSAKFASAVIDAITESLFVEFVTPYYHFNLIKSDPDDNKFVDCAITSGARYVVTNDRHYDVLKTIDFPTVDVISIKEFFKLYFG
ncbi:MAG: putative toxin-antitoxin system toxin component, PIN family [Bacteroidales bacterium]|nr:putative toxin-antitoxin system toxin component, PIN family [Bacteroidales bacterium]